MRLLAVPGRPGPVALARCGALESGGEFSAEIREIALHSARTTDEDVVVIRQAFHRQGIAQQLAEAALHAVAHHGVADLLRHRDTEALALTAIRPREQDEPRTCHAQPAIGGEEIGSLADDGKGHKGNIGLNYGVRQRRWPVWHGTKVSN